MIDIIILLSPAIVLMIVSILKDDNVSWGYEDENGFHREQ